MRIRSLPAHLLPVLALACTGTQQSADGGSSGGASSSSGSASSSSSTSGGDAGVAVLSLGNDAPGVAHAPLADDAHVQLVMGPQGGYHVWLSVGVPQGLDPGADFPVLRFTLTNASATVGQGGATLALHAGSSGTQEDSGVVMLLDWGVQASGWMDQPLEVNVELRDSNDRVIAAGHRRWLASCCDTGGTRGGDGGFVGGGPPGDGGFDGNGTSCGTYCDLAALRCTNGAPGLYADRNACLAACAAFGTSGVDGLGAGDTLQCRMTYLLQGQQEQGTCTRLQEFISTFCVDTCTYYCTVMQQRCASTTFPSGGCVQACGTVTAPGTRGVETGHNLACYVQAAEEARCSDADLGAATGACAP